MATSEIQLLTKNKWKINGEAGADYALSMEGVATNAGRVSAQIDLGADPRPYLFLWTASILMQATPTQSKAIDFYVAGAVEDSSGDVWGDIGTTDAALGDIDQLKNLIHIGSVIIEEANTTEMVGGGWFEFPFRYMSFVMFNNDTGATTNATDSNCKLFVERYSKQGQAT